MELGFLRSGACSSSTVAPEVLGRGDVRHPWQADDAESILPRTSGWRLLQEARFAVLDRPGAAQLARYPPLTGRLVAKTLERSRNLAIAMASARHSRLEVRLHMLFWHLADRWGRVASGDVVLPLRVTHFILGDLLSAHPASVSTGLSVLSQQRLLHHSRGEWLLCGDPPCARA
jgi:CRP/FNR family transcriptional regulator, cyclic AMP receptor protein